MVNGIKVMMFPGLGASYPQMLAKYLAAYPQDNILIQRWSDLLGFDLQQSAGHDLRQIERHKQLEIHALNLLWWYRQTQVESETILCGHSLGYYAALTAAGVITAEDSFRLIDRIFALGWDAFADHDDVIFVLTTKNDFDFTSLLAKHSVETLSINNQQQRVLYGSKEQFNAIKQELNQGELLSLVDLGSKVPFHSHRMISLREQVANLVEELHITAQPLNYPIWSHISARPLTSSQDALQLIVDQLHQPVHWHQLVDTLIQAGRYHFIEVGPNRILSQLVRWISPRLEVSFVDNLRRQQGSTV